MILSYAAGAHGAAATIFFAVYMVLLQKFNVKLTWQFWIQTFAYLGALSVYTFRSLILNHDLFFIRNLIEDYTFTNAPFFIIGAVSSVILIVILHNLIFTFGAAKVAGLSELFVIATTASFAVMGHFPSWASLFSLMIIAVGAIIFSLEEINLRSLLAIPRGLMIGIGIGFAVKFVEGLVTFLGTKSTPISHTVLFGLKHVFPFSVMNPFYFTLGTKFFMIVTLFAYIKLYKHRTIPLTDCLKKHTKQLIIISSVYFRFRHIYTKYY